MILAPIVNASKAQTIPILKFQRGLKNGHVGGGILSLDEAQTIDHLVAQVYVDITQLKNFRKPLKNPQKFTNF